MAVVIFVEAISGNQVPTQTGASTMASSLRRARMPDPGDKQHVILRTCAFGFVLRCNVSVCVKGALQESSRDSNRIVQHRSAALQPLGRNNNTSEMPRIASTA